MLTQTDLEGRVVDKVKTAIERIKTFPGIAKAMAEQWAGKV